MGTRRSARIQLTPPSRRPEHNLESGSAGYSPGRRKSWSLESIKIGHNAPAGSCTVVMYDQGTTCFQNTKRHKRVVVAGLSPRTPMQDQCKHVDSHREDDAHANPEDGKRQTVAFVINTASDLSQYNMLAAEFANWFG